MFLAKEEQNNCFIFFFFFPYELNKVTSDRIHCAQIFGFNLAKMRKKIQLTFI